MRGRIPVISRGRCDTLKKMSAILRVRNLTLAYGDEVIVKNFTADVERGEFIAVIGPNGAGKTTLAKALLGLIPAAEGTVKWNGSPRVSYLPDRLSPQQFLKYPMTVRDFFGMKGIGEEKTRACLESVGLQDVFNIMERNPGTLSSGQFQRMMVGWALARDPEVLIFDEPTTGIDVGGEETVYSLISSFWKEKKLTVLLVTHELNVVYAHATHVLCMRREEAFYGPPREVLTPEMLERLYGTEIKFHQHAL